MDALHKWWFIFWMTIVGGIIAAYSGLFYKLLHADVTYLGITTIVLYVIITGYIGTLTRKVARDGCNLDQVEIETKPCWFATEAMLGLGMIGTVAGFLIMLNAFNVNVDPSNFEASKTLITKAAVGMSTSAVTTVVGIIFSLLGKLQLVNLEKAIDEARLAEV